MPSAFRAPRTRARGKWDVHHTTPHPCPCNLIATRLGVGPAPGVSGDSTRAKAGQCRLVRQRRRADSDRGGRGGGVPWGTACAPSQRAPARKPKTRPVLLQAWASNTWNSLHMAPLRHVFGFLAQTSSPRWRTGQPSEGAALVYRI